MAEGKINKVAVQPGAEKPPLGQTAKQGPSKYDFISSRIAEKVAADLKLPAVTQPSPDRISAIESALKQKLEKTDARSATEFFRMEMTNTRQEMNKLAQAVGRLQPQSASSSLRERLNLIEQQFQKSAGLIQRVKDMDPKSLLNVQLQLYQIAENIELMSKVVEQVNTGVKTVMQTQV
jgi:hypothetical protein